MELAYRLGVDDGPYIRNIRDHMIRLTTPTREADGGDRMLDINKWHFAHAGQHEPGHAHWGEAAARTRSKRPCHPPNISAPGTNKIRRCRKPNGRSATTTIMKRPRC